MNCVFGVGDRVFGVGDPCIWCLEPGHKARQPKEVSIPLFHGSSLNRFHVGCRLAIMSGFHQDKIGGESQCHHSKCILVSVLKAYVQ